MNITIKIETEWLTKEDRNNIKNIKEAIKAKYGKDTSEEKILESCIISGILNHIKSNLEIYKNSIQQ